ncbi:lytic transglycosylase domain-containing protein [Novosphingobium piscinae]|uniref:Lytic transglycosylase domain-containing protein n=1 Tax=Novosphingobium piscinae TaxID=1507448 RepID=A0A7X1FWL2_9SPHN|nr:lytic transglycosylase domain-containing protein [Novosphingobium piscinae]MBC2668199.1 lytic transglycosylase domain-containing protein [Novosphingobium piscinae]
MVPLSRLIGMVGLAIAVAFPAGAQETTAPKELASPLAVLPGVRVDETSGGFQLIQHGIWASTLPATRTNSEKAAAPTKPAVPRWQPRPGQPTDERRASYLRHVQAAEARYALPAGLLDALVWTESRYNPFAMSKAGAAGLGQLMPATARLLGVSNRFQPIDNIYGAARYLRWMLDRFGMVHLAVAAYNAGPGAVSRAGGVPLNGETPGYVREVLRHWKNELE